MEGRSFGVQCFDEHIKRGLRLRQRTAGEHVHGQIAPFGVRVKRNVRFRQNGEASDAEQIGQQMSPDSLV